MFLAPWRAHNINIMESIAMVTTYLLHKAGPITLTKVMIEALQNELAVFNKTLSVDTD